jgi:hypothetical protein
MGARKRGKQRMSMGEITSFGEQVPLGAIIPRLRPGNKSSGRRAVFVGLLAFVSKADWRRNRGKCDVGRLPDNLGRQARTGRRRRL